MKNHFRSVSQDQVLFPRLVITTKPVWYGSWTVTVKLIGQRVALIIWFWSSEGTFYFPVVVCIFCKYQMTLLDGVGSVWFCSGFGTLIQAFGISAAKYWWVLCVWVLEEDDGFNIFPRLQLLCFCLFMGSLGLGWIGFRLGLLPLYMLRCRFRLKIDNLILSAHRLTNHRLWFLLGLFLNLSLYMLLSIL